MKTASCLLLAVALATALPAGAKLPEFTQATRVQGKVPVDLGGAWFMYPQAEFPGNKMRVLPLQLFQITKRDGAVDFKLLDVKMPSSIDEPYKAGNRQPRGWEPKPEDIELLRKDWSKLPPAESKDWRASEVVYDRVEFTVAAPDKYTEAFGDLDAGITEALTGSVFALQVLERYKAQPIPPGQNVAQVMQRKTIYVVRNTSDGLIEGKQFTGYIAAGPGTPLPITFVGPFKLYRLASGTNGKSAPGAESKPPGKTAAHK